MKVIVFISALLASAVFAEARSVLQQIHEEEKEQAWMTIEDEQGNLHYLNLRQTLPRVDIDDSIVTFHYRSRQTESTMFTIENIKEINNVDFNPERRTIFIIHGWNNNKDSEINQIISPALLDVEDWNVFIVDWSGPANEFYTTAKASVNSVGEIMARFIRRLMEISELNLEKVTLVGHSLGAHVAGHASKMLDSEISAILGLDPAMPFFSYNDLDDRLDPTDAKHVQVIHTNGGFLGFLKPLGHADFYPNGGMNQKGCGIDIFGKCAHSRSYIYFSESLTSKFIATSCPDVESWEDGTCNGNKKLNMGGNFLDTCASGSYYLDTATNQPFALQISK